MNRSQIVEILDDMEQQYAASTWSVCGIDVWPLLKIQVFFFWFQQTQKAAQAKERNFKAKGKTSISAVVRSFAHWCRFLIVPMRKSKFVFSGADSHCVDLENHFINRYFDPMMDFLESEANEASWHLQQTSKGNKKYYRPDRTFFLQSLFPLANAVIKLRYGKRVEKEFAKLTHLDACLAQLESAVPGVHSVKKKVVYSLKTILVWALIFDRIFVKTKCRYAFGLCYYSLKMYGMNVSARRCGVISVDMQHGSQGALHVAYNNFNPAAGLGYSPLPKIFWCWDHASAGVLESWIRKQDFHQVIVGGNPWLEYMGSKDLSFKFPVDTKVVLLTLQPVEPLLANFIIEAMRASAQEFEWWLRLHPRQFHDKDRLLTTLQENGITNVVVEEATYYPLPAILQHAVVHLSRYSGAVIEASLMGVPNIVFDEIGVKVFRDEIDKQRAVPFLNEESEGLLKLIRELSSGKTENQENSSFKKVLNQWAV